MLTLYDQEQATQMMLANERKEAEARGEARGEICGGIKSTVEMCQEFGTPVADAVTMLVRKFGLTERASHDMVSKYWKS